MVCKLYSLMSVTNGNMNFVILDGPINISLSEIMERRDGLDKQPGTVVICHHGMRSSVAAEHLVPEGFEQIVNLEGH